MAILKISGLTKNFGGLRAVDNVTFAVEKGEIFGLIGPNGSGKTTIFNMISHFYPATEGRIVFNGTDITRMKTHQVCALGVGRTFQIVRPLKRMTVLDNVIASAFLRCHSMAAARALAEETLDFCGLTPYANHLAKGLSIASRKRLEITRAMATKPSLLLLDETAAGLNPGELDEAIDLIKKIRSSGVTIVIVEHIMRVIMAISDRIHCINHGQTIAEGSPKEVANNPKVIEAYLGHGGGGEYADH